MKGKNLAPACSYMRSISGRQRRRERKDEVLYFEQFLEPPSSRLWRAKVDELLKDFHACNLQVGSAAQGK